MSVLVTLAGTALATYLEYRQDLRSLEEQVAGVETFVPTLSTSLWRLDDEQIHIQLRGIVRLPAVRRAAVVVDGREAYSEIEGPGATVSADEVVFPLAFESAGVVHRLGDLIVTPDRSYATERVPTRFLQIASIQAVRGILIAGLFFWVFSHLIGRRLKALSDDIDDLSFSDLQSRPIPSEAVEDELSQVRDTLETMRRKILEGLEREQEFQAQLEFQRLFDPVTGLPNRTLLTDRLETLRQSGANAPLLVVAVELLRLSEIDYMLDLPTMQRALREVAQALQEIAPRGLLSRYSERRFVLVAGPVDSRVEADRLVSAIAARFEKPFLADRPGSTVFFSAAFGVARLDPEETEMDATRFLARAVLALDSAVAKGEGARAHWDANLQHATASVYQELRTALAEHAFSLHCQPIFDLETLEVESMECLIRWHSERLGTFGVQASIDLIERSGMSGRLDRAVLDAVLDLRRSLRGTYDGPLALNLTARSLSDQRFAEYVANQDEALLDELELELTETSVLHDVGTAQRLASKCRELGVHLVLDDFGTGFSSIEYLSQFHFYSIKVDRSFLRRGLANQLRLLQSMVSIAHGVGSRAVAEGIESEWQLELARGLGFDSGQGILLCPPIPEDEVPEFLRRRSAAS